MTSDSSEMESILQATTLSSLAPDGAVDLLGSLVDRAYDARRCDLLRHMATLSQTINLAAASPVTATTLHYYLGNLWSSINYLSGAEAGGSWDWDSEAIQNTIISLRRAIRSPGFRELPNIRRCQIFTNLANCFSTTGRFIEAIETWNEALSIEPRFGMARGNQAVGRWSYAKAVYDNGHAYVLAREAWRALDPSTLFGLEPGAGEYFAQIRRAIEQATPPEVFTANLDMTAFPLGETDGEVEYRRWCLLHCLFLNPLNDLGPFPIGAQDILTAPSIVMPIGKGPRYHGFFNQIKQEFCSARWFAYQAMQDTEPHFADRGVLLYNTLDFPSYSIATEQLKLAFRASYSLFDKIAFFLNAYMSLGIPERRVSFRGLWYDRQERQRGIRPEFTDRANWPLRGLFWLGKDLYEDSPEFRATLDPEAQELSDVRNHLEHKYLKVHTMLAPRDAAKTDIFADDLARSISRHDFEAMLMRVMAHARAAIIYLSLGIHEEERVRARQRQTDTITPPMILDVWEDDWKR